MKKINDEVSKTIQKLLEENGPLNIQDLSNMCDIGVYKIYEILDNLISNKILIQEKTNHGSNYYKLK